MQKGHFQTQLAFCTTQLFAGKGGGEGLLPVMAYKWKFPLCKFVAYSPRTLFSDGLQMLGWAMQKVCTITLEIFEAHL